MAKLLKPMIILLLVLSIAALALGFQLFSQRETLKGRVAKLQDSTQALARGIKYDGLNPQMLQDYASMDGQLAGVTKAAQNQYEELQTTQGTLESTKQTLASTEQTLSQTKTELDDSKGEVEQLQRDTSRQKSEIAQKARNIDSLEQAQTDLESQVESLSSDVQKVQAQLRDRTREFDDLLADYTELANIVDGGEGAAPELDPDLVGKILVARPEWNFVIIDLGSNAGVQSQAELLVHRDRELVGRIRVAEVTETLSVGEVINDWEVSPAVAGDVVIPPGT